MTTAGVAAYRFDGFVLDLVRGTLLGATGNEIPLRRKSYSLLCFLLQNAGRLLDRNMIHRAIWGDVAVTDDAITQCIREIRLALGDVQQHILKTIPRRGYILAAQVALASQPHPGGAILETATPFDKPSIAVLAFSNMSTDPDQEYFSDGIADDIITGLSHCQWLFVIARISSFSYRGRSVDVRQIAHELSVRYVLEGGVRRSGTRVRVTARLIEAESGNHIWAERYDHDLTDLFAVQDEITARVINAILPVVTTAEQRCVLRKSPETLDAWEAYQRGLWHMGKGNATDNEHAKTFLGRASVSDPSFAAAYSHLALAYFADGSIYAARPISEATRMARDAALKAVANDPSDADAQAVLAFISYTWDNRDDARERASAALASNASSSWAHGVSGLLQVWGGQTEEGRQELRTALRLSPHDASNVRFEHNIAISYYYDRDYEQAADAAKRVVRRFASYPHTYCWLSAALGHLGRVDQAREVLCQAIAISPSAFDSYVRKRPPWFQPEQHEHLLAGLRKAGLAD